MKSFALTLDLQDDAGVIAEYKRYHREVWPEVIEGLRSVGIVKMKIFLKGTRMFMYIETGDDFEPARDFQAYTESSLRAREWDEMMRGFQVQVPGAAEGEWWASMEEAFDIDWF